ncbi:DUF3137 domain-containing protein [Pelagibacterium xiamenense]|uniref:DUF3137 domain-containing protein n=1 Tax=Pelagibacterium xiamenense TaxID=2901140 RepID=UPI001E5B1B18|nr:DUF3137 domain-containing protein [Pelagibacterium xiamenense]MCD7060706.1 DUF3137 domain-containing protein [Pelagibacterium xiamenense]
MWLVVGLAILGAIGFGAVAVLAQMNRSDGPVALAAFAVGFGGLLGAGLAYLGLTNRYKQVLTGGVCAYLGFEYAIRKFDFPLDRFKPLLPFYKSAKLEDRIEGHVRGVDFELCEGKFSRQDARWRALMLVYSFNKPFDGETTVVADTDWVGNALERMRQNGGRVRLEDPRFEDRFEVFSTDQVEARYLLTPRFMERIVELTERLNNRRGVSMAFMDNRLLINVRIGSAARRFEIGNVFRPIRDGRERARNLLSELELVTSIIDSLDLADTSHA